MDTIIFKMNELLEKALNKRKALDRKTNERVNTRFKAFLKYLEEFKDSRIIGHGNQGVVLRVIDTNGQCFAVKFPYMGDSDNERQFTQTANKQKHLALLIKHHWASMACVYDWYRDTAFGAVKSFPLLRIFINHMKVAITYVHWKGMMHRDIKPDNIYYDGHMFYLGDLGEMVRSKFPGGRVMTCIFASPYLLFGDRSNTPDDDWTSLRLSIMYLAAGLLEVVEQPPVSEDPQDVLDFQKKVLDMVLANLKHPEVEVLQDVKDVVEQLRFLKDELHAYGAKGDGANDDDAKVDDAKRKPPKKPAADDGKVGGDDGKCDYYLSHKRRKCMNRHVEGQERCRHHVGASGNVFVVFKGTLRLFTKQKPAMDDYTHYTDFEYRAFRYKMNTGDLLYLKPSPYDRTERGMRIAANDAGRSGFIGADNTLALFKESKVLHDYLKEQKVNYRDAFELLEIFPVDVDLALWLVRDMLVFPAQGVQGVDAGEVDEWSTTHCISKYFDTLGLEWAGVK